MLLQLLNNMKRGGFGNANVYTQDDLRNMKPEDFASRFGQQQHAGGGRGRPGFDPRNDLPPKARPRGDKAGPKQPGPGKRAGQSGEARRSARAASDNDEEVLEL